MSRQRRFLTCSWNQVDLCQGAVCLLGRTRREGFYFRRCGVRSDGTCRARGINPRAACFVYTQAGQKPAAATALPLRCLNGDLWKRSDCALLERLCCFCWRKRATHSPRAGVRSENEAQKLAPRASGPPEGISPFAGPPWTTTYNAAGNARECRCRRAQEIFCAWRGITPRPRVLPYQLVGGKRPAGSPAER